MLFYLFIYLFTLRVHTNKAGQRNTKAIITTMAIIVIVIIIVRFLTEHSTSAGEEGRKAQQKAQAGKHRDKVRKVKLAIAMIVRELAVTVTVVLCLC